MNKLYYGDNLTVMRDKMKTASVDLIYLDPPFNSNKNYNLLYRKATGVAVPEQEIAFYDAWELTPEKQEMIDNIGDEIYRFNEQNRDNQIDPEFLNFWNLWVKALQHTQPKVLAYLVYMTYRLLEMKRILKPSGSIYLHCDPTCSHYIKVMMDAVFGHRNFRNEIVWHYQTGGASKRWYGRKHDILLFYTKSDDYHFYPSRIRFPRTEKSIRRAQHDGARIHADDKEKLPMDVWVDIQALNPMAKERLGYPTQKPIELLDRIIKASSNPGDIVFDPFCGCGTAIYAAHLNNRRWVGCDIAILSVHLVRDVLDKRYGLTDNNDYTIDGVPLSVDGAQVLFKSDPHQFQNWAVDVAGGFCSLKKSGDQGIDGRIHFEVGGTYKNMVLSVKGGHLQPVHIRELRGVLEREDSIMAGFICLSNPTQGMINEAASAGQWEYEGKSYERMQIRTIANLLNERGFDTPTQVQTLNWDRQLNLFS